MPSPFKLWYLVLAETVQMLQKFFNSTPLWDSLHITCVVKCVIINLTPAHFHSHPHDCEICATYSKQEHLLKSFQFEFVWGFGTTGLAGVRSARDSTDRGQWTGPDCTSHPWNSYLVHSCRNLWAENRCIISKRWEFYRLERCYSFIWWHWSYGSGFSFY